MGVLSQQDDIELRIRLAVGNMLLELTENDWSDDERADEAKMRIRSQMAQIRSEITRRRCDKPATNTINAGMGDIQAIR